MFKNLKIRTRLTLGFGATIALGIGIALISALQMNSLSRQLDAIANDRMVKVEKFSSVKDNLNGTARAIRNVLLSDDPALEASEKKKIEDLGVATTQILAALDPVIVLPKGRDLFKIIQASGPIYNARMSQVLTLEASGDRDGAAKLLLGEVRAIQNALFKAVDDSVDYQRSLATRSAEEAKDAATRMTAVLFALAAAMAALGITVTWLLVRNLSRALGAEPGELGAVAQRVAAGDLSPVQGAGAAPSGSVMSSLADMQMNLARVVGQVRASSSSIATGSAQIATGNQDLSQRTEEQATNLEQTAASMEQLTATVKSSAETANAANRLATSASAAARKGGDVVGTVVQTMQDIAASSKKIADIIGVIDSIAFQTNILALNAAVEAARAGEQGRGFAVVASEVRNLASRSADAAKEIKTLIGASVDKVEAGSKQVDAAGNSMNEIVTEVQQVSQLIGELSTASGEQSVGISQIRDAVGQLDQVTQQNAALVEESAAAAESLREQAAKLAEVVGFFHLGAETGGAGAYDLSASPVTKPATVARRPALKAAAGPARLELKSKTAVAVAAKAGTDEWATF